MKKLVFILLTQYLFFSSLISQIVLKEPLSDRQTYYKIDAFLNTETNTVEGEMSTYWVNRSNDIVPDVQMHLYLNAFRNRKSTFNSENSEFMSSSESDSGFIEIKSLTGRNEIDLIPSMHFISPDDGNIDDMTVLKIDLPEPARPGDTVFLQISFESKLPSTIIRTGYAGDFYFVGQWFPKFGVYEKAGMRYATVGAWNCHQFHSRSEFYSNHSVYDVKITVPKEYVVGSGGMLLDESDNDNGLKSLTYRAEDIVDFAWTAWPGYAVYTDQWKDVKITLLLPPERRNQVDRQFKAVKNALEYLGERVGPYPWPHLTFVDPPTKGAGSGGMEYTTLFTSASSFIMPSFFHMPEMVTIHEFGHAYFMGILASNEFEEPWLDEGVNTFWEGRIVDHYYGENSGIIDLPFFKVPDKSLSRSSYIGSGSKQVISNIEYSWNYPHGTYGMMSYNKAAVILNTLMGLIGEDTMDEVFRVYYKKWAFRHPSGKDFVEVVNEVVTRIYGDKFGSNMNWFFDQTLYGTGICDYKVSGFTSSRKLISADNSEKKDSLKKGNSRLDSLYNSVVKLERAGEIMLPVEVLVHFKNGEEIRETWDGKSRYKDFNYERKEKILWVKIDPDYKLPIDINYINNSRTLDPDLVPVRRMSDKLIVLLQFIISVISL